MDDSEEEIDFQCTPDEIIITANEATQNLLPVKSRAIYNKEYDTFMEWRRQKQVKSFTERVLLAYFQEKSKIFKSSTLWSCYSKLKSTLILKNQVNIGKYPKVIAFLKRQSVSYKPKKSKIFLKEELNTFLLKAPDDEYLMIKVALIFGIAGACRKEELYKMLIDDIIDKQSVLIIKIPDTKTHTERIFTVIEESGVPATGLTPLGSLAGSPGPPLQSMDLLAAMGLSNVSWPGVSMAPGYLKGKPAYLLEGDRHDLRLPSDAFREAAALLRRGSEFTVGAWLRQEIENTGTIFSVSNGPTRFLEVQSSGRRNEIRLHYTSLQDRRIYMETFHYRLADNMWHHLAVTVSGSQVEVLVDCHPLYKRVLRPGQPDRNVTDHHQIWVGQRHNHYFFKGFLQDVRLIEGSHGVLAVCPQLDVTCPTCGQFLIVQTAVQSLERKLIELSQRLANAEMRLTLVEDCDCQKSCRLNDTIHADGTTWQTDCDVCSCKGGEIECHPVKCAPTDCKHPVKLNGCCHTCLKQCYYDNVIYDHDEVVTVAKCKDCTCVDGSMDCKLSDPKNCPVLSCPHDQQIHVSGSCCPICKGVDYCAKGHVCHSNATCRNLQTTYACQCDQGFRGDGRMCADIDECQEEGGREGHHCHSNTRCVNTQGSYECHCLDGYVRVDRFNCAELDECSTGAHNCDLNAGCVNTEGSYKCQCRDGYEGDGYQCTPICIPGCLNGGICLKPNQCSCPGGYTGTSCERDLDECSTNAHRCTNSSICVNMMGWYYCQCKPGYEGPVPDNNLGTSCIDIDECEESRHTCHSTAQCVNTDGGFDCSCPAGSVNCRYSCIFEEREVDHGTTVQSKMDPCLRCTCNKGVITCEKPKCDCRRSSSDRCCPQCDSRHACRHQELSDVVFMHGERWSYQCQTCECLYGEIDCWELKCPPLICSNPIHSPGDCCPHCGDLCSLGNFSLGGGQNCTFKGALYQSGSEFLDPQDPCATCKCKDGQLCCNFNYHCGDSSPQPMGYDGLVASHGNNHEAYGSATSPASVTTRHSASSNAARRPRDTYGDSTATARKIPSTTIKSHSRDNDNSAAIAQVGTTSAIHPYFSPTTELYIKQGYGIDNFGVVRVASGKKHRPYDQVPPPGG